MLVQQCGLKSVLSKSELSVLLDEVKWGEPSERAIDEVAVALAEALLHAPGEHFDFLRLAVLSLGKLGANFGFATVGLC